MKILQRNTGESRSVSCLEALAQMDKIREERDMRQNEAFQKTIQYFRECPGHESASWIERVRKLLTDGGLTEYETSLVINLAPETYLDAKLLIPSLSRFDNYTINLLLNEIASIASS